MFGASVVPLSQAIMVDTFEAKNRGKAMAIWGIGILLGPIMGPTVGGFITDHLGWRWVFYINVPIGIINLALIAAFLKQTPRSAAVADWIGALLLAIGVGSLQMLLDRGNSEDWLQSNFIVALAIISMVCLVAFIVRSFKRPDAILQLGLLKDRNLATATFIIMAFGVGMLSTIALQPLFLEHLLGYPAGTAGLVMAPRGIAVAFGMVFVATTINRFEATVARPHRLGLAAAGSYATTWYNLDDRHVLDHCSGHRAGCRHGHDFRAALDARVSNSADGRVRPGGEHLQSCAHDRRLYRHRNRCDCADAGNHANWQTLGAAINPYNPALSSWLDADRLSMSDPRTAQILGLEVMRQSTMIGFLEAFGFVTLSFLVLIPFVLLLKRTAGSYLGAPGQQPTH